eukprot:13124051-Alexandrium_andersonii.AAC.1
MSASLVGSEMCIRDSSLSLRGWAAAHGAVPDVRDVVVPGFRGAWGARRCCLLYTSDAADDM